MAMAAVLSASCSKEAQPTLKRTTIRTAPSVDASSNQKPIYKVKNTQNSSNNSAYRNSRKRVPAKWIRNKASSKHKS